MSIKIYQGNTYKYSFNEVIDATLTDRLSGELTLEFTVFTCNTQIPEIGMIAEFDGQFYDIIRITKSISGGLPTVSISCEHVSYRLNNEEYNLVAFVYDGSPAAGMSELLSGTDFSVGSMGVSTAVEVAFTDESPLNRRSALQRFASACGGELIYNGYSIGISAHRGSTVRRALMDGETTTALSVTTDAGENTESYDVAILKNTEIAVGDEVSIVYTPLSINKNTRIVGMTYNPFYRHAGRIEVGEYDPALLPATVTEMQKFRQEFRAANGELQSVIEELNGSMSIINQTAAEISLKVSKNEIINAINTSLEGISINANKLDLSGLSISIGTTSSGTSEAGEYVSAGTAYRFTKTNDGYYTSTNAGANTSYSYGKMRFNFTESTTVTFECISYGENNYDFGIISTLDYDLTQNNTADTSGVAKSYKGLSSPAMQSFTMTIPAGNHYVTFKYIKDGSTHDNSDSFKLRCKASIPGLPSSITLKNNNAVISSANINLSGLVTFSSLNSALSGNGTTSINGANITTGKISADRIDLNTLSVKNITFNNHMYDNVNIVSSELISGTNALVKIGVTEELASNMMQITEIYGSRIFMIASGYTGGSARSLLIDCVNHVICPYGNAVWEIGSYDYPFGAVYTDDIYFRDGLSRIYINSSGTLKFYSETDGRTYNIMLD